MDRELEILKKEYEEKLKRKEEKKNDKDKDKSKDKDKGKEKEKESNEDKAKTEESPKSKPEAPVEAPSFSQYQLHRYVEYHPVGVPPGAQLTTLNSAVLERFESGLVSWPPFCCPQ